MIYLLHGSGHDPQSVRTQTFSSGSLAELGTAFLVVPAGDSGWWIDSPVRPLSKYSTYLLELVEWTERHYPVNRDREARAICGFSMGGYGAMLAAAQHPELFCAASSLLGTLDIAQMYPDYYRLQYLLGDNPVVWQRHNPIQWVDSLAGTALLLSTATQAFDRPQNDAFAQALRSRGIPFEYCVQEGGHDISFVRENIGRHLGFHRRTFERSRSQVASQRAAQQT